MKERPRSRPYLMKAAAVSADIRRGNGPTWLALAFAIAASMSTCGSYKGAASDGRRLLRLAFQE